MVKVSDIFKFIDSFAPFDTALDFDNVGLLVGDMEASVKKCVIALDITPTVVEEAKTLGANLIISHHPVIFNPIKVLNVNSVPHQLAKHGISAICAHTNFDIANFGVNFYLAKALSLSNLTPLSTCETKKGAFSLGLVGNLSEEKSCEEFAKFVKERLDCKGVRYTNVHRKIRKVALCSGAGGDLISEAIRQNADAFVTGEIKHHEILAAVQNNVCVVDAGHFKTEDVVVFPLVQKLSKRFAEVEFVKSMACTDEIRFLI